MIERGSGGGRIDRKSNGGTRTGKDNKEKEARKEGRKEGRRHTCPCMHEEATELMHCARDAVANAFGHVQWTRSAGMARMRCVARSRGKRHKKGVRTCCPRDMIDPSLLSLPLMLVREVFGWQTETASFILRLRRDNFFLSCNSARRKH